MQPNSTEEARFIELVKSRQMIEAWELFARNRPCIERLHDEGVVRSTELIDALARLLDRDTGHLSLESKLLTRFHEANASRDVVLIDWTRISLAGAIVMFHQNDFPAATTALTFLVKLADTTGDDDLRAIVRYYLARAVYRTGEFAKALDVITEAGKWTADPQSIPGGLILMVKAWLQFNSVGVEEAEKALRAAQDVLSGRDFFEDANIVSLCGRFARQQGDFDDAIARAREALAILDANGASGHANAARCYVHMAYAQMLKAYADGSLNHAAKRADLKQGIQETLTEAEAICRRGDYPRVLDRVHYFRATWSLMLGDDESARRHAVKAHTTAESVHDHVVMAHSLILQCQCARLRHDREEAQRLAMEAYMVAARTDNRRVKIRALIWRAFVESDAPVCNIKPAKALMEEAALSLRTCDRDYLRWEFDRLARQIDQASRTALNEELGLPATVDDVVAIGDLRVIEREALKTIIRAVHRRVGTIAGTAKALRVGRQRIRRLCPELKH